MNRCKDCHWATAKVEAFGVPRHRGLEGLLVCIHPKFKLGYGVGAPDADGVRIEDDEEWGFRVGPEFGCVHFEAKG